MATLISVNLSPAEDETARRTSNNSGEEMGIDLPERAG